MSLEQRSQILATPLEIPNAFFRSEGLRFSSGGGFTLWAQEGFVLENGSQLPLVHTPIIPSSFHSETTLMSTLDLARSSLSTETASRQIAESSGAIESGSMSEAHQTLTSLQAGAPSSTASSPILVRAHHRCGSNEDSLPRSINCNSTSDDSSFLDSASFSPPTDFDFDSPTETSSISATDHLPEDIPYMRFDVITLLSGLREMGYFASEIAVAVNDVSTPFKSQICALLVDFMEDVKKRISDIIELGVYIEGVVERVTHILVRARHKTRPALDQNLIFRDEVREAVVELLHHELDFQARLPQIIRLGMRLGILERLIRIEILLQQPEEQLLTPGLLTVQAHALSIQVHYNKFLNEYRFKSDILLGRSKILRTSFGGFFV